MIVHRVERAQVNRPQTMLNCRFIPPSIGLSHGTESERQGRIAIEKERSVHCSNGTLIIMSKHGNNESGYSERQGVVCCRRHYRTGMPHSLSLIHGAMATPEKSLLVAPCGMSLRSRIIRLSHQCLKQKAQCLFAVLWGIGVGVWQCTEVEIIGVEAVRALATCPLDLSAAKAWLDSSNHTFSNLVLKGKDVVH